MANDNNMNISEIATEQLAMLIDNNQTHLEQALRLAATHAPYKLAKALEKEHGTLLSSKFCTPVQALLYATLVEQIDWLWLAEHYIRKADELDAYKCDRCGKVDINDTAAKVIEGKTLVLCSACEDTDHYI